MNPSAHDRQVLDDIGDRLARSDPALASLLGMFTRLTSGEPMPVRDNAAMGRRREAPRVPATGPLRHLDGARRRTGRLYRRIGWQWALMLLWMITALGLTATALALGRGGGHGTCGPSWISRCSGRAHVGRLHHAAPEGALGLPLRQAGGAARRS